MATRSELHGIFADLYRETVKEVTSGESTQSALYRTVAAHEIRLLTIVQYDVISLVHPQSAISMYGQCGSPQKLGVLNLCFVRVLVLRIWHPWSWFRMLIRSRCKSRGNPLWPPLPQGSREVLPHELDGSEMLYKEQCIWLSRARASPRALAPWMLLGVSRRGRGVYL
jgi:hypothetical protein